MFLIGALFMQRSWQGFNNQENTFIWSNFTNYFSNFTTNKKQIKKRLRTFQGFKPKSITSVNVLIRKIVGI